jgi:OOP family OmpA-OmpF porin
MRNILPLLAVLCTTTFAGSVRAQVPPRDFRSVEGAYVGGALSAFGARTSGVTLKNGPSNASKNGNGGKLFAGFQLTENFGFEAGGIRSSTLKRSFVVNDTNVTQKGEISAFYLAGTGRLPIGDRFAINARAGFARSKLSGTNVLPIASTITGSKSGVLFGIGGEYRITPEIAATLDYDYLPETTKRLKTGMISLGVKVVF